MTGFGERRWFDSHCHIQEAYLPADEVAMAEEPEVTPRPAAPRGPEFPGLSGRLEATVARSAAAGVGRMVCVGTDASTSRQAVRVCRSWRERNHSSKSAGSGAPELWATVGLHPHDADDGIEGVGEVLAQALRETGNVVVAVGECGLDYHYEHSPRPAQRRAFAAQIALAHQLDLTLVVHARSAWDDLFDIVRAEGLPERAILHCFTGGPDEARRCLDLDMYLSFSGIVTFKNAHDVRAAVDVCPLDRLLIETDSPFLAPAPHRGKENEPAFVPLVGEVVAQAKGLASEELAASSWNAASVAFGLDP